MVLRVYAADGLGVELYRDEVARPSNATLLRIESGIERRTAVAGPVLRASRSPRTC